MPHKNTVPLFPRRNVTGSLRTRMLHWLHSLVVELHPATTGCAPCRNLMPALDGRLCHQVQPEFPVDVVYTWVNGKDPAHMAKREHYVAGQENIHVNGLENARFRDNEELRYSLRAIETFAPWVRSIILATDNQVPHWLLRNHPKLRVVDHTEFIPQQYLPTFNSHVIEAFLHRIPDLAEHYMYLNDDVFLARPTRKTDFFMGNGLPLAFVDWRGRRLYGYHYTKTPHAQSYFNTLRILEKQGVATDPRFITAHGPYPQTKTNTQDAFVFFEETIQAFANNRFRTTEEIAMYAHALPLWIYGQRRLIPADARYYYVQTRRKDRIAYYKAILRSRADGVPPLFFCINDVGNNSPTSQWRRDLRVLLEAYYPQPSSFETDTPKIP